MFSKSCEYGIRAVIYIAAQSRRNKLAGVTQIAKATDAPKDFTAKILQDLSRRSIINSIKGRNGGFFIDKKRKPIYLYDIVTAIDGDKIFTSCGLGMKECSERKPCPIHNQFKKVRNDLSKMMKHSTVDDLVNGLEKKLSFLKK